MNKRLVIAIIILCLFLLPLASAQEQTFWAVGKVSSEVYEQRYDGILHYRFTFLITETNGSLAANTEITAIVPTSLMPKPIKDFYYNFSGYINTVQTGEIPSGYFVVESVNTQTQPDWLTALIAIIHALSGVMSLIANTFVSLIFAGTGFLIPEIAITLILVAILAGFLLKNMTKIGLLVLCVIGFLIMSGTLNILRLALQF